MTIDEELLFSDSQSLEIEIPDGLFDDVSLDSLESIFSNPFGQSQQYNQGYY